MRPQIIVSILASTAMYSQVEPSTPMSTKSGTVPGALTSIEHKHHHRAPKITTAPTITITKRANDETTDDMPEITDASTSYSYSIAVPQASESDYTNPYIQRTHLPRNLVFIIVGAIIGFMLAILLSYRILSYVISNRRAKSEKEVYFSNSVGRFLDINGPSSSSSSILEKSSSSSMPSLYLHSRQSSIFNQQLNDATQQNALSQAGHSYRDNSTNRGSMFISPVLEIMKLNSSSQLELPLYHKNIQQSSSSSLILNQHDSSNHYETEVSSEENIKDEHKNPAPSTLRRPPSQYLDDLIDYAELSFDSKSSI
ncbi:uncharacterized protein PRCAT00005764001 [Priceomyces carsonii]|uniref:uncharacterized protein n=1 Tax=Priceomyces carsonii TaxID=28549 RepID=UPI002EDA97C3|nr:unnamed protein product [Priceomyces carsonii]